jgi:hypothetical protein
LIPNLWCICKVNLDPVIISQNDQFVAFTCSDLDKVFGIIAVYASTCYLKRRQLWNSLSALNNQHNINWCFMGDFNVILGHHEYRGSSVSASCLCQTFKIGLTPMIFFICQPEVPGLLGQMVDKGELSLRRD